MKQDLPKVYEKEISATPDRVWKSLTDPAFTERYYFGTRVESDWQAGSQVRYKDPDGNVVLAGEVLEVERPRRLVTTFEPGWAPRQPGSTPSAVTWEITPTRQGSKLRLTHSGLDPDDPVTKQITDAWDPTLTGLKDVVEAD